MNIIRGLHNLEGLSASVLTIGNFDGMHLGHQQLLDSVCELAQAKSVPSVLMTFEPQPNEFFARNNPQARLSRLRDKYFSLRDFPLDYLLCVHFNQAFANIAAHVFIEDILVKQLGAQAIVVGDDFRFGQKRLGDFNVLKTLSAQFGYQAVQMPTLELVGERVSSTRIRQALLNDNLALAEQMLGHPYRMSGRVAHGDKRGRELGFPTANIFLHRQAVAVSGIYVAQVHGLPEGPLLAAASVGERPMFDSPSPLLEVHILDFDREIYGQCLQVELLSKIRDQEAYDSLDDLITQMHRDIEVVRGWFKENSR